MLLRLLALLFLFSAMPAMAANTYYVSTSGSDSNSCATAKNGGSNQSQAKRNIMGANGGARCLASGDTLLIRGGSYNEALIFGIGHLPSGRGTWDTATRLAGYPGEVVRLTPTGRNNIELQEPGGWNWIIIDNLSMDADGFREGGPRSVTLGNDTHHIRVSNCTLTNSNMGFFGGGHHNEFLNNKISNAYWYGFYQSGQNNLLEGNDIFNNGGYGIHLFASQHDDVNDNIIRRNRIHHSWNGPGMIMAAGYRNQAYNNVVHNNPGNGIEVEYGCKQCKVFNNTVFGNTNDGIFIGTGSTGPNPPTANTEVRNNLVFQNGTNIRNNNSSTALSDNLTTDPLLNGTTGNEYRLSANSPRNNGHSICTGTVDFYGQARPQGGRCDIGAAEYTEGGAPPPPPPPPPPPTSGTNRDIYVRASGGTPTTNCVTAENPATPIRTITAALACMTTPGKVMYVEGNGSVYTEQIDTGLRPITGGNGPTFTAATRIEGYGDTPPIIRAPSSGTGTLLHVHSSQDHYLIFKNLVFDQAGRPYNAVVIWEPAHHIKLDTVEIKSSGTAGVDFEGLYIYKSNGNEVVDTFIHDTAGDGLTLDGTIDGFLCQRCHLYGARAGVKVTTTGAKNNIIVKDSEVRNNRADGLDISTSTGMAVQNNVVQGNAVVGIHMRSGATGWKVTNNTIYNNTGAGFQCDQGATGGTFQSNINFLNKPNLTNLCGVNARSGGHKAKAVKARGNARR